MDVSINLSIYIYIYTQGIYVLLYVLKRTTYRTGRYVRTPQHAKCKVHKG